MKYFVNDRRAVSTVITTAIMLSAVAMMGSFLVLWSNSTLSSHKMAMETAYSNKLNKLNELLVIEHIWFGQSPSKFVNITVNNAGSIWLNVTKIQISSSGETKEFLFHSASVAPNKSNSTTISYNWVDNTPVDVIVTTARGSIYRTQVMP
jgi:archaellum component FlaF (FlaF/FlaG flagellin family)